MGLPLRFHACFWGLLCGVGGCMGDRAIGPEESLCDLDMTREQRRLLTNLRLPNNPLPIRENCASPWLREVASPYPDVPKTDVEDIISVFRLHRLHFENQSLSLNDSYPCEIHQSYGSICGDQPGVFVAENMHLVLYETEQPLPLTDPNYQYELGFAFDSDQWGPNNYQAPATMPRNFYTNTDTWYKATYQPNVGWKLQATNARFGVQTIVPTRARVLFDGTAIALLVPGREFDTEAPPVRVSLFRHTGDFGQNAPHDWSAFVHPRVEQGLFAANR